MEEFSKRQELSHAAYLELERPHWMSDLVVGDEGYQQMDGVILSERVAENGAVLLKRADGKLLFVTAHELD